MYSTGQVAHFDVLKSYEVFAPAGERQHTSEHAGWEFNFAHPAKESADACMRVRGRDWIIHKRNFLAFNSQEEHVEVYSDNRSTTSLAIVLPDQFVAGVLSDMNLDSKEIVFHQVAHELRGDLAEAFGKIFSLRESGSDCRVAFECHAVDLILKVLESCPSTASDRIRQAANLGCYPSNVARVQRLLVDHISDAEFSLDALSELSGISKFHLVRSFKARTGITPGRYLNLIRVEMAKALLAKGVPVGEAALQCGFNTFSAFNKAFKRHAGIAPSRA